MSRSRVPKDPISLQASPHVLPQHVALYMRVSSEDQADRGTIEAQRNFLHQFTSLYQLPVADEYADDGVTGTLPLGQRPEGRRLLQDAEAKRFGCVIVYRLTRLGRSLKALTEAHEILSQCGVTIRSATEPFDTSTPIGTFLFQLLSSLAELDRAQVMEQLTRGRDRVAKNGKWTNGPLPFGYAVDHERRLVPSTRLVEVLGMTEAEVVQDLFRRIASGSSSAAEARRLNAVGVPTTRYYSNGTQQAGKAWYPGPIAGIIANPTYRGVHVLESGYGTIERAVPALVDVALWEQANAQLTRNRHLPKGNATRTYLLSGLITCGKCKNAYVGQALTRRNGTPDAYYRCGARTLTNYPARQERCRSRAVSTAWLEHVVWEDCRAFIRNPGEALAEAQRQLHDRLAQAARMDQERGQYVHALAEKAQEKDRIMTLFRRGRIRLEDVEVQLDDIAREEAELRQRLAAIDAQKVIAEAYEAHMTGASLLLHQLQDGLAEIDRTNDLAKKQQVVELLVQGIRIDSKADRGVEATITYVFGPPHVADYAVPVT